MQEERKSEAKRQIVQSCQRGRAVSSVSTRVKVSLLSSTGVGQCFLSGEKEIGIPAVGRHRGVPGWEARAEPVTLGLVGHSFLPVGRLVWSLLSRNDREELRGQAVTPGLVSPSFPPVSLSLPISSLTSHE